MDCRDCQRFDLDRRSCKDGKMNPRTLEQAVDIARIFGVRAVCVFNDHRERLVHVRTVSLDLPSAQARLSSGTNSSSE